MADRFFERRRHKRYTVNGICGNVLYSSDLNVINISISGAAIETTKKIELNREYPFKIKYKDITFNVKGRVVWSVLSHSKKMESGEVAPVYRAGVQFTDVMSEKANLLIKFIEENIIPISNERRIRGVRCKIATSEDIKVDYPYGYSVREMSLSGMLIETEYPLNPNNNYTMELLLNRHVFSIVGRVVSCAKIDTENGIRYNIGIEFVEMSEKDREVLKSYLDNLEES